MKFLSLFNHLLFVLCLSVFTAFSAMAQDEDLSGTWTITILQDSIIRDAHYWTLNQSTVQSTPVIKGNGLNIDSNWTITGTYKDSELYFVYYYPDSNPYQFFLTGRLSDSLNMSGEWADTLGQSGTWNGFRSEVPSKTVVPSTPIKDPPVVEVKARSAILTFRQFSGVGDVKAKLVLNNSKAQASKLNFRYDVEISRKKDAAGKSVKGEVSKKTTKKNQLALKGLKPGQYSARYRVEITKKQNGKEVVTGRTKFSPAAAFSIE